MLMREFPMNAIRKVVLWMNAGGIVLLAVALSDHVSNERWASLMMFLGMVTCMLDIYVLRGEPMNASPGMQHYLRSTAIVLNGCMLPLAIYGVFGEEAMSSGGLLALVGLPALSLFVLLAPTD